MNPKCHTALCLLLSYVSINATLLPKWKFFCSQKYVYLYLQLFLFAPLQVKIPLYGCDCYAYALLSSGFVDLVVESGLKVCCTLTFGCMFNFRNFCFPLIINDIIWVVIKGEPGIEPMGPYIASVNPWSFYKHSWSENKCLFNSSKYNLTYLKLC